MLQRPRDDMSQSILRKCDRCGFSSLGKRALQWHYYRDHVSNAYKCDHCDYASGRPSDYARHVGTVHRQLKLHYCEEDGCEFSAMQPSIMKRHVTRVHTKLSGAFRCLQCSYESANANGLRTHTERVHEKKMQYHCAFPDCSHTTYDDHSMRDHMRRRHWKLFHRCVLCPFETFNPGELTLHLVRAHPDFTVEAPLTQFLTITPTPLNRKQSAVKEEEEEEEEEKEEEEKCEFNNLTGVTE